MSDKDFDYIVKVERAIQEKYGEEAIQNPRKLWNKEKEDRYLEDLKEFYSREKEKGSKDKVGDIYISRALLERKSNRDCPVCEKYSFDGKDDLYMNKFTCCFDCYIQFVEGREERWSEGWRPGKNTMAIMK